MVFFFQNCSGILVPQTLGNKNSVYSKFWDPIISRISRVMPLAHVEQQGLKTFELLGWVKTNPKNLKVFNKDQMSNLKDIKKKTRTKPRKDHEPQSIMKGKGKGKSNFLQIMEKKRDLPQDLPRWITGDLANTDQDDYFISEVESEKRIFIILQIMITFLLIACCILVEKCFNNSSFSVNRRIIHTSNGK